MLRIKNALLGNKTFSFSPFTAADVWDEINHLDSSKTVSGNIPVKILKMTSALCFNEVAEIANAMLESGLFPNKLKKADVSPIFKNVGEDTVKKSFRPISVLSALSKVFERLMATQMLSFIQPNLSNLLCGFREGFSTQHALFRVVEMFRRTIDQSGIVGVVLKDLSKAYDCLSHDLLIAKMAAYGFSNKSLELLYSYLSNREQRVQINSTFSDWK